MAMGYQLLHSGQPSAKRLLKRVVECTGVENLDPVASQDVVIRWGCVAGDDSRASYTLNPREAILNSTNRLRMLRVLKLNGIYSPAIGAGQESQSDLAGEVMLDSAKKVKMVRHYRVPIFDMQPLALFRADAKDVWLDYRVKQSKERFLEVDFDEDKYATRAVRLALRSLHALGLDFGLVTIGITTRDRTICINVNPTPILHGRMLDLYADALNAYITRDMAETREWQQEGKIGQPFMIGTDLEFMLRSAQGKMVLASKYLPRKGNVGCDDRSLNHDGTRFPLAELRPEPADYPEELMANIRKTMGQAMHLIKSKNLQWLAGSMPFPRFPLGGHIHFSDLPFSSRLIKAFDNYVGFPIMMIEASQTAMKRRPKYGFLGDVRFKAHGGFEYRTPGSWIVSPEVANAVIALSYVVATHYRDLNTELFSSSEKQRLFYNADKPELMHDFQRIWRQIENTSSYRRYQQALRVIPDMVRQGIAWNEAVDIRRTWGIGQEEPKTQQKTVVAAGKKKVRSRNVLTR
jgi:hypothetical protein